MMLFNYMCFEEMTAPPIFSLPWDKAPPATPTTPSVARVRGEAGLKLQDVCSECGWTTLLELTQMPCRQVMRAQRCRHWCR